MGVRAEYRTYGVVVDLGTVREAVDAFGEHLVEARFVEVQRLQQQSLTARTVSTSPSLPALPDPFRWGFPFSRAQADGCIREPARRAWRRDGSVPGGEV